MGHRSHQRPTEHHIAQARNYLEQCQAGQPSGLLTKGRNALQAKRQQHEHDEYRISGQTMHIVNGRKCLKADEAAFMARAQLAP